MSPVSTQTAADNDYYFAGVYTNVVAGNGTYEPVGTVPAHEESAAGRRGRRVVRAGHWVGG